MKLTGPCAGKTILLVDDDSAIVTVLQTELAKEGAHVLTAENGKEGLAVALAEHPDLTVLDILMPVLDGIGLLKKLREDDWGKKAKVLIQTNVEDVNKVADALSLGVYEFLIKEDMSIEKVVRRIIQKVLE